MPPDPVLSLSGWPGRLGSQLLCPAGASGVAQVLPNSPGLYPPDSQCSPGQHFHRRPPARGVAMATPSAVRQTDSPGTLRGAGIPGVFVRLAASPGSGAPRAVPGARASSHGPSVSKQAKDPSPVRLVPRPPPRPAPPETVLVPMSGRLPGSLWCGCFVLRLGSGDTLPLSVSSPLLVGREVHGVLQEAWGRAGPGAFAVQRPFA